MGSRHRRRRLRPHGRAPRERHYRRTPAIRAITALLGAGLSAFIAALFIVPDQPLQTGTFTYGFLAVADLVSAWHAAKDAAIADWIWGKALAEHPPAPMPWEIRP